MYAILDTNVYINHWERGAHDEVLAAVRASFIIRHSSVVLSELRRGARTARARQLVESLRRVTIVWAPLAEDWWEAGVLIATLGDRHGWSTGKRRDFQNDALIALTARRHGSTVVTSNHRDFALLSGQVPFRVLFA